MPAPTALDPYSVKYIWLLLNIFFHFFISCSDPSDLVSCKSKMSNPPLSKIDLIFLSLIKFLFACPCILNDPILRLRLEYCEPGCEAWLFGTMVWDYKYKFRSTEQ